LLCLQFIDEYPQILDRARVQKGQASFYPRRRPADSRLDPEKSIAAQFDLLRVVDNEKYPAFFEYRGKKFQLKIEAYKE
jgi:methionyl-tRNA formyltransferase